MAKTDNDQPVRILHLSDIHFRVSKAWDADPVLRALTRYIRQEVEGGNGAGLGGHHRRHRTFRDCEYALARAWLDDLWKKLGDLSREHLLLVPGNHDVDRSKIGRVARLIQSDLLNGRSRRC